MRKVIVLDFMTLDGVVQAPGHSDEDRSGGFKHGGWHMPYMDELAMRWMQGMISGAGGFVLGRRTYEIFAGYWPNAPKEEQALAQPMNHLPKYVASRSLPKPLAWQSSSLLEGDVAQAVAALKREQEGDLLVPGSTELVRSLMEKDLVDEFQLMIDPLVLGGGKRLFPEDGARRSLRLVRSQANSKGSLIATFAPAGEEAQLPAGAQQQARPREGARA